MSKVLLQWYVKMEWAEHDPAQPLRCMGNPAMPLTSHAVQQVLSKTGVRYRYKDSFKISRTYVTTYAGGSVVSTFAPSKDQYIWFDDFQVWTGSASSGCGGSSPPMRSSGSGSSSRPSGPSNSPLPLASPSKSPSKPKGRKRGSNGTKGASKCAFSLTCHDQNAVQGAADAMHALA
jgi:hypothetical protein